jgi:catechol 2,3-dioxygenase-like lactoylglutathione lyase family enzyme
MTNQPAPISGFDHVSITVADIDAACRFYERVLGARVEEDYKVDGRTIVRRVMVGKAMFNIHQQGNGVDLVARVPTPGSVDLCFRWTGTIESAIDRLKSLAIQIIEGPAPRIANDGKPGQSIYFRDPDGNLLELLAT